MNYYNFSESTFPVLVWLVHSKRDNGKLNFDYILEPEKTEDFDRDRWLKKARFVVKERLKELKRI